LLDISDPYYSDNFTMSLDEYLSTVYTNGYTFFREKSFKKLKMAFVSMAGPVYSCTTPLLSYYGGNITKWSMTYSTKYLNNGCP